MYTAAPALYRKPVARAGPHPADFGTMFDVPELTGMYAQLQPLTAGAAAPLLAAANRDRSTFGLTRVPDTLAEMQAYVESMLSDHAAGLAVPFVVVDARHGDAVGSTRFLDIECWPGRGRADPTVVEIGGTWLAKQAQRTAINTEMKYLMLCHAFETWEVLRVSLKTDARNERSRTAIARIGASYEGIRRAQMPASDGGIRDSAYFSIVAAEWPAVKAALLAKLS